MTVSPMATTTDSVYCYINSTNHVQSIRLVTGLETLLEKLVFPRERVLLEISGQAELEIVSYESGLLKVERISYWD